VTSISWSNDYLGLYLANPSMFSHFFSLFCSIIFQAAATASPIRISTSAKADLNEEFEDPSGVERNSVK